MPIIKRLYRYEELSSEQEAKAREIIDASVKTKTVIMPFKDISKYRDVGLGFAFNFKNVKNMFRGLHRRYVINKGEELVEPLWSIALRWYILRAVRRKFLKPYYSMPVQGEKYFYYPLHMPIDMQILVRSPQFFDQYYLIEYIARSLPHGVKLYVKEHPVSIGMYDYFAMRKVAKIPNVLLINPNVNSHPIIQNAQAVITVNSKVGYEALYHGKPVITVGDSFYRKRGLTIDVENLAEIGQAIKQCQSFKVDEQKLTAFVYSVYANAFPGELYQNKDENYRAFGDSLLRFLDENRI
jgi:capsule polysaccharide modification protein KpsS